jgi:dTDP-4-amino-4,6-dideoxygalactose transaminase
MKKLDIPRWPPVTKTGERALVAAYRSGKWSFNGPVEQALAREFAAYHGAKHGIFMANGTVTLQCALAVCGVGRGDEVIVPALTWIATAMAVHYVGAKPVFADVEPTTLCLDPAAFEEAITARTRAVVPVHLYGSMADLDAIRRIARRRGIAVIEDCAHMQGGKWKGRGVGSWGNVGSFSFQESKTLACGEGGICITSDDGIASRLYRMKHIGYDMHSFQGQAAGGPPPGLVCYNFRGTEFQAAILRDQLGKLPRLIARYNRSADRLGRILRGTPGVRIQARGRRASPQGYYGWVVMFDEGPTADVPLGSIQEALRAEGVGCFMKTYGPVYRHVLWNLPRGRYRIAGGRCPVAEETGTKRALVLHHWVLGSPAGTIDAIGKALVKVARNAKALR